MFLRQEPQVVDACVLLVSVVGQDLHTRVHESRSVCMCYVRMQTHVLRGVRGWEKGVPTSRRVGILYIGVAALTAISRDALRDTFPSETL